jgi:hypothetical protein
MRLTIIPSDGAVYENGVCYSGLSWEGTPANVHALQWFGSNGWLEFNDGSPNEDIAVLPLWVANAELAWDAANTPVPPEPPTPEQNKATAMSLLSATDWTELPSVSDPTSNPHLLNKADFVAYRDQLRAIAVNPPAGDITWPTKPTEQWSS